MTADYILAPNPSGLEMRTEINAIFSAILSQNSSATEPTSTVAGMFWYDTTTSIFKQRNSTNDGWVDKWDTTKGMLASLASPTFTGSVNLPTTSYIAGNLIASLASPTFTGTVTIPNLTVNATVSLPAATSIGSVSQTEISYLDGVTSAIQTQLNAKQATLVSGTNIKTVNGTSILGSGNIAIQADSLSTLFANSQTFTASGTFVVPAGVTRVLVEGCGGGGGGGAASGASAGGGGGGGADSPPRIVVVTPGASVTVTIGAGGAGGTIAANGATGGAGGTSYFGTMEFGGALGGLGAAATVSIGGAGAGAGGVGGTGVNATAITNRAFGGSSSTFAGRTLDQSVYAPGCGGSGRYGIGALAPTISRAFGNAAEANTGAGGSGALAIGDSNIRAGGAGGSGKVIVYW